jgi:hypothetical protein
VKLDYSDLLDKLKWAMQNDDVARRIAENAAQVTDRQTARQSLVSRWRWVLSARLLITVNRPCKFAV